MAPAVLRALLPSVRVAAAARCGVGGGGGGGSIGGAAAAGVRWLAAAKKGGRGGGAAAKGGGGGVAAATGPTGWAALQIYKDVPGPTELEDDAYPDWLWTLTDPAATQADLTEQAAALWATGGVEAVVDTMGPSGDLTRLLRTDARARLRERNDASTAGL
ncbi:hypothetical protein I4F81_010883 [Pyropia yezoensis]|uniref:Uncharacterized protein n=1 Tax=Pyropia yezoensis TaxID=2788 RepID=A0ACC3CDZ4_PYRYE|nr:hypothetical protein I4F81_010883 [Neopyropia yezoensis]